MLESTWAHQTPKCIKKDMKGGTGPKSLHTPTLSWKRIWISQNKDFSCVGLTIGVPRNEQSFFFPKLCSTYQAPNSRVKINDWLVNIFFSVDGIPHVKGKWILGLILILIMDRFSQMHWKLMLHISCLSLGSLMIKNLWVKHEANKKRSHFQFACAEFPLAAAKQQATFHFQRKLVIWNIKLMPYTCCYMMGVLHIKNEPV